MLDLISVLKIVYEFVYRTSKGAMETYKTLKQLGKGSFGTVYLCERIHNKLKIVVKEINLELDDDKLTVAKNEVAVLKAVDHPNIIQYYDSFVKNGTYFIVMEYARHGNLYEFIRQQGQTYLSANRVLNIFCQILMGLDHIHLKKIIHRDLKTENIFLTGPSKNVIKIGDFGISKILINSNTKANTVIGTTNYIAPEMCDGQPYDAKSDIWSLGCILYELCAMERLFDGSISEVVLSIKSGRRKIIDMQLYGASIQEIINATVKINPEDRPTTTNIMAFPSVFPMIQSLVVNLGNIDPQ